MGKIDETEIDLEAIGHLLADKLLSVPRYQRSYAWTEDNIRDLFQDLGTALAEGRSEYFLGNIVTTPGEHDRLDVVDGQQRLATTTILIAAIRDYFSAVGDKQRAEDIQREYLFRRDLKSQEMLPRLQLNDADNDFYLKAILSDPTSPDRNASPTTGSHKRLLVARTLAADHVASVVKQTSKATDRLSELVEFLVESARVIFVQVSDTSNAFVIFETLNDRGLDLAISDLLKNYLFLVAEKRIDEVQHNWLLMMGTLESIGDETAVADYIRHLWSSKKGATRERELYQAMKDGLTSKQAAVDFSKELCSGAQFYAAILNTEHALWGQYGTESRSHMSVINFLEMVQIRPLLLAVMEEFSPNEVKKALKLMVAWGVRFLVVGGLGGGTLEKRYASRACEVRAKKIKNCSELAKAMASDVPTDTAFSTAFQQATVSKAKLARYYLRALEKHSGGEKDPELIPNPNELEVNLEHVLPQNPGKNWKGVPADLAKTLFKRLGNLALMKAGDNSAIGNVEFAKKKVELAKSSFKLTKQIAGHAEWGQKEIEKRQAELAKLAVGTWSI